MGRGDPSTLKNSAEFEHNSIFYLSTMANSNGHRLYTTDIAEKTRQKIRFDPLHPEFIRQEEEEVDEFEEDIGMSKTGTKRKHVRTDVDHTIH